MLQAHWTPPHGLRMILGPGHGGGTMTGEQEMRVRRVLTAIGQSLCGVLAFASLAAPSPSAHANDLDFDGSAWARAAGPHGLDPALLYALTLVESRRAIAPEMIGPWPWVIRTPTGGYWFNSRERAEQGLEAVLAKWPAKRVDVGIAQVNVGWHANRFDDPVKLLGMEYNLEIAAGILADAIDSTRDTVIGVGRYHHWASESRSRAYGQRVWSTYRDVTFASPNPAGRFLLTTEADLVSVAAELARE